MIEPRRTKLLTTKSNPELAAWAMSIIAREQQNGTYGQVIIQMEKGRITRVVTEKSEKPPSTDDGGG